MQADAELAKVHPATDDKVQMNSNPLHPQRKEMVVANAPVITNNPAPLPEDEQDWIAQRARGSVSGKRISVYKLRHLNKGKKEDKTPLQRCLCCSNKTEEEAENMTPLEVAARALCGCGGIGNDCGVDSPDGINIELWRAVYKEARKKTTNSGRNAKEVMSDMADFCNMNQPPFGFNDPALWKTIVKGSLLKDGEDEEHRATCRNIRDRFLDVEANVRHNAICKAE